MIELTIKPQHQIFEYCFGYPYKDRYKITKNIECDLGDLSEKLQAEFMRWLKLREFDHDGILVFSKNQRLHTKYVPPTDKQGLNKFGVHVDKNLTWHRSVYE